MSHPSVASDAPADSGAPAVSVVIPTRNRPELVDRAVHSALAQSLRAIEVIVVIDGPDPLTVDALAAIDDDRLRVVTRACSGGAPTARNDGIAHARAPWVALLDDDDEWLPEKLERQLAVAAQSGVARPIISSRLTVRTPRASFVLPRRLPAPGQPPSEYLAVRHSLFHGDGFIQTSTIMAPTDLLRQVPFDPQLRRLQELDWALRCLELPDVALHYVEDPVVIWNADENRNRVSFDAPWQQAMVWLEETRGRVTPRAYAALAMSVVSAMAVSSNDPRVFARLLHRSLRYGRPGPLDFLTLLHTWLVPVGLRRRLRDWLLAGRALPRRRPRAGVDVGAY